MKRKTFAELYRASKAFENDIDDYIEEWHNDNASFNMTLHEHLGMTWEEYGAWVEGKSLDEIL